MCSLTPFSSSLSALDAVSDFDVRLAPLWLLSLSSSVDVTAGDVFRGVVKLKINGNVEVPSRQVIQQAAKSQCSSVAAKGHAINGINYFLRNFHELTVTLDGFQQTKVYDGGDSQYYPKNEGFHRHTVLLKTFRYGDVVRKGQTYEIPFSIPVPSHAQTTRTIREQKLGNGKRVVKVKVRKHGYNVFCSLLFFIHTLREMSFPFLLLTSREFYLPGCAVSNYVQYALKAHALGLESQIKHLVVQNSSTSGSTAESVTESSIPLSAAFPPPPSLRDPTIVMTDANGSEIPNTTLPSDSLIASVMPGGGNGLVHNHHADRRFRLQRTDSSNTVATVLSMFDEPIASH